jgi:crotonobetainyl-CoA:carnitine CoA-transferase CaiB-like acyl-CoA transferase
VCEIENEFEMKWVFENDNELVVDSDVDEDEVHRTVDDLVKEVDAVCDDVKVEVIVALGDSE